VARGLLRTARPKQWIKNVLVLAAPGSAGVLTHPRPLVRTAIMVVLFTMASASTYLINDTLDAQADREHPTKQFRPVASGLVPPWLSSLGGVTLGVGSLALAYGLLGPASFALIIAYLALTASYSTYLKREPVVELVAVAAGFVLRAVAGGVAAPVPLSELFLTVACFASLVMVIGKRIAEENTLGDGRGSHRAVLEHYGDGFLKLILGVALAVTIAAYCLWAFEKAGAAPDSTLFFEVSIAPFMALVMRYALLIWNGQGGAPEDLVTADRRLQVMGLVWLVVFTCGVYHV
jgi:decaprenyl-phosphate phosphoribosyltransferase